jgi:hypothetical protein
MNRARGTITVLQEERFQLYCDDGVTRLFVLAHDAPLESGELAELKRQGARVEVEYDEQRGLVAHAAHRIRRELHEIEVRH